MDALDWIILGTNLLFAFIIGLGLYIENEMKKDLDEYIKSIEDN